MNIPEYLRPYAKPQEPKEKKVKAGACGTRCCLETKGRCFAKECEYFKAVKRRQRDEHRYM